MATEILLARHAEAKHVARPDIVAGRATTSTLTDYGFDQSLRLGSFLPDFEPTHAHVSPAIRSEQTAVTGLQAAEIDLELEVYEGLHEQCLGENEGRPRHLVYTPEVKAELGRLGADYQHPGFNERGERGESLTQVVRRMLGYVARTRAETDRDERRIFAVGHHIAIKGLVAYIHLGGLHTPPDPLDLNQAVQELPAITPCGRSLLVVEGEPDSPCCAFEYVGEPLPERTE